MEFKKGQLVVLRGRALGVVQAINPDRITVDESSHEAGEKSSFEVPIDSADALLRPLVGERTARTLIDSLQSCQPDAGSVSERSIKYRRVLKSGDLDMQAQVLGGIYRHPNPDYPESQYKERLERVVYGELAMAIGKTRKAMKAEIRGAITGELPPASLSLPDRSSTLSMFEDPPKWDGHDPLGPIAIDTKLAVGEAHVDVSMEAATGVWLIYTTEEDGELTAIIAVHSDAVRDVEALLRRAIPIGETYAEGATIALFDEAAVDDEFADDVFNTAHGILGQRCAVVSTAGDGCFTVKASMKAGRVVVVRVDLE